MRVIAGSLKGRRLKSPAWEGLRPTSDKLRETVFNILASRLEGARVIDGYAGTGALGIEAFSRGARSVVFVERDRRAQALIRANLAQCGVTDGCVIIPADILHALTSLRERGLDDPVDVILLDPPYSVSPSDLEPVLRAAGGALADGGIVMV